ncbi:hypothetical protein PspLS_11387 [Pyricularia sp. CBS 133598]|nr:hypothetical protein PspLS_11387 [Pyricularia sp. CBS 133598]
MSLNSIPKMSNKAYESLDQEDPLSSRTKVDRSAAGHYDYSLDEKDLPYWPRFQNDRPLTSRTEKLRARLGWFARVANTVLLVVIAGLLAALLWRDGRSRASLQVGGDFGGAGPKFSTKITKWDADEAYVPKDPNEFFAKKTIDQWNTMMPAGNGWRQDENITFFTTSMTHQLHCVFMMARIYAALQPGVNRTLPEDYQSHYLHCVDYLRQAIMCAGDVAMEPHSPTDADDNGPGDGSWAGYHVCKDYSQVTNYIEVQPPRVSTDDIVPLHHFDNSEVLRRLTVGWATRFDEVLDPDVLYQALEALIRRDGWRKMGGRLRLNSMGRLESHIPADFTSSRPAVRLSHTAFDMAIDEHPMACRLPRATGKQASSQTSTADLIDILYPVPDRPTCIEDWVCTDEPQLRLYVVSFNDATLVSMTAPHALGDIMAHAGIVRGWVDMLHGRGSQVQRFEGFRTDPLAEVVKGSAGSRVAGVLEGKILTGVWYAIYVLYFLLDMLFGPRMESRTLFFPASTVAKMREQALDDLRQQGDEKPFVSNGDVITAWITKMTATPMAVKAPQKDLTILNAIDLRGRLRSALDPAVMYGQNLVMSCCAFITLGEAARAPLGVVAGAIRQSIVEQAGEEQMAAFTNVMWELGGDRPVSRTVDAYLFAFSSWAKARLPHIMDFSPAIVSKGRKARTTDHVPGRPVLFLPTTTGMTRLARYWINITGEDLAGNHWVSAILPPASHAAIEEGMRLL